MKTENSLDNNQPLVAMLKRASEISITDRFLHNKASSGVPEDALETPEDTSERASPAILASLLKFAATHPDVLDSLLTEIRKKQQSPDDKKKSNQE